MLGMPRLPLITLGLLFALAACGGAADRPAPDTASGPPPTPAETAATPPSDPATRETFERVAAFARENNLAERPIGEVVQALAERLLGTPYVEGRLDVGEEEALVIDLTGFDCVTYVENVLAMAQAVKAGDVTYDAYAANLEALRYRGGALDGYCSRLHYFSDWMRDNDRRGNVEVVTDALTPAAPFNRRITFMSEHREAYPRLATDDEALACIRDVEGALNQERLTFVPQNRIRDAYAQLQAGDVIAITSDVGGLDIAHTGFVYKFADGRTGFIHASTTGRVVRNDDLARYVEGNRRQTGIMVARPLDPAAR
jgi:hypothetical protein